MYGHGRGWEERRGREERERRKGKGGKEDASGTVVFG